VYFQVIQLGTADREAELAMIGHCVDQSIGFWHLKCAMDVRLRLEELIDGTEGQFYLLIAGMCGSERRRADCGSIFVVNSVIQFVQQHRLVQEPHPGVKFNSNVPLPRHALLATFFTFRPRGTQARPGGSNTAEIHESNFTPVYRPSPIAKLWYCGSDTPI
jgi:hypothetical protein